MSSRIIRYITDANYRFCINNYLGFYKKVPDDKFVQLMFRSKMGYEMSLDTPITFNEKIQWMKIYDRNPVYSIMADKIRAKQFVSSILGEDLIIPTLATWDRAEDIDFDSLPNQFVIKCNHNSGLGMAIVKDKNTIDKDKIVLKAKKGLEQDYYLYGREWAYRDIPRKVFAEKYMIDDKVGELRDYKFFCFNGVCKFFKIDFDRFTEHRANYYDRDKQLMTLGEVVCPPNPEKRIQIPDTINQMIEYAEKLAKNCPFVRVDFYDVNNHIYFGELTFYPSSGCGPFTEPGWDEKLGEWLELPEAKEWTVE